MPLFYLLLGTLNILLFNVIPIPIYLTLRYCHMNIVLLDTLLGECLPDQIVFIYSVMWLISYGFRNEYGFRHEHSTEFAIYELIDRIIQDLDKNYTPISIFLYLSKAFDTLDHYIWLDKLQYYGINGTAVKLSTSYLDNRKQYVDIDATKS